MQSPDLSIPAANPVVVAAPVTPPILADLVAAHRLFIARRQAASHTQWLIQVADEIDARIARERAARAEHIRWIIREAAHIDWCADPTIDLN